MASVEYDHAVTYLKAKIVPILERSEGPIRLLDVGCGQGHLLERLLASLPPGLANKIVVDYLDPQEPNLNLYRQRLSQLNLGGAYCMRWEDFVHQYREGTSRYDVIIAFQSLYTYDLTRYGGELARMRDFLKKNDGIAFMGHSTSNAAYLEILGELGPRFHPEAPRLNTAEDVIAALRNRGLSPRVEVSLFKQSIPRNQRDDLMVYLAACLFTPSPHLVEQRWGEIESYIRSRYFDSEGERYVFDQDIAFIEIRR